MMTVLVCGACGARVGRAGLVGGEMNVGVTDNRGFDDIARLRQTERMGGPVDEALPLDVTCSRCKAELRLDFDQADDLGQKGRVVVRPAQDAPGPGRV
jgi:hypothetical protein